VATLLLDSNQSFLNLKHPSNFAVIGPESAPPLVASIGERLKTLSIGGVGAPGSSHLFSAA
jgi:hypothetical protein